MVLRQYGHVFVVGAATGLGRSLLICFMMTKIAKAIMRKSTMFVMNWPQFNVTAPASLAACSVSYLFPSKLMKLNFPSTYQVGPARRPRCAT